MKNFKSSVLSEKIPEYVHPENDGNATSSSGSEATMSSEDSESDMEDSESEGSGPENELAKGNSGWADAMSKILRTNKPKKKKTVVLSRAKKLSDIKANVEKGKDVTFEIEGEIKKEAPYEDEPEEKSVLKDLPKVRRKEWEARGRVKPVYPDPEREKSLSKIAIKGVVQLFNAVSKHQSEIESKMKEAGPSEIRREKVLKSVDKRAFLDVLMGNAKSETVDSPVKTGSKIQLKEEETHSLWSVLRDDFLTDPSLKDWDKEAESETNENMPQESLSSDDDDDVDMT